MRTPPQGVVTLLMTDIEGSTHLWESYGSAFFSVLDSHNRMVRAALGAHGGWPVKSEGDSWFYVFSDAREAVLASVDLQQTLIDSDLGIRIRVGIHTGQPTAHEGDYYGPAVNRVARITDAAPGGVILISAATHERVVRRCGPAVTFVDRGEHRLRGLGRPERLYQVIHPDLARDFGPLRTLEARPNNLPAFRTQFIGRRRELTLLDRLLREQRVRLLTLTGAGGVGKTRLAVETAASHIDSFPHGVWFVPLADTRDPAQVAAAIAGVILGRMPTAANAVATLQEVLRDAPALVVLDSFEHLLPAAEGVNDLLAHLPQLHCMVTSRCLLNISGEREFHVPSLEEEDSLELFLDRARAARPTFALDSANMHAAAAICQQLDGLPLAIELAAARVRGLAAPELASRLERRLDVLVGGGSDLPNRQRTMRAALDWSYDLLSPAHQQLFCALSVFSGGFFLDAAEQVCGETDILDGLFCLRDRSLVTADEIQGRTRYRMLPLVREYALGKRGAAADLRDRHLEHFSRLARVWGPRVPTAEQRAALRVLDLEQANLASAVQWAEETGSWDTVALFLSSLLRYAYARSWYLLFSPEAIARAAEGLNDAADTPARAWMSVAAAVPCALEARFDQVRTHLDAGLGVLRRHHLHGPVARAVNVLGWIAADQGRLQEARDLFVQGLALCVEGYCGPERASALQSLSVLELSVGEDAAARRYADECRDMCQDLCDRVGSARISCTLGLLAWRAGDHTLARRMLQQGLYACSSLEDRRGIVRGLWGVAIVGRDSDKADDAAFLALVAREIEREDALSSLPHEDAVFADLHALLGDARMEELGAMARQASRAEMLSRSFALLEAAGE